MTISQRAYARHRGCDPKAVRVAIAEGRLPPAVLSPDGKKILSAELADAAWAASTHADMVPGSGPTAPAAIATAAAAHPLAEHRARHAAAAATIAELELAEKRGQLVRVEDVEATWSDVVIILRTKLLGLAARARVRDPSIPKKYVTLIDTLVREALTELADEAEPRG